MTSVVPMAERMNRNVLFTCLGSPGKPMVDTAGPLRLQPGDRLLLCSDGLWGSISDAVICEQMGRQPLSDAVPELVEQALRAAGPKSDNVTVLCVEWESAEEIVGAVLRRARQRTAADGPLDQVAHQRDLVAVLPQRNGAFDGQHADGFAGCAHGVGHGYVEGHQAVARPAVRAGVEAAGGGGDLFRAGVRR